VPVLELERVPQLRLASPLTLNALADLPRNVIESLQHLQRVICRPVLDESHLLPFVTLDTLVIVPVISGVRVGTPDGRFVTSVATIDCGGLSALLDCSFGSGPLLVRQAVEQLHRTSHSIAVRGRLFWTLQIFKIFLDTR
jgi:hypothetical protein